MNYLNIFGSKFNFTIFGENKFHTTLGIFLSLVCDSLVIALIAIFGLDLFNRDNPKIIFEQTFP